MPPEGHARDHALVLGVARYQVENGVRTRENANHIQYEYHLRYNKTQQTVKYRAGISLPFSHASHAPDITSCSQHHIHPYRSATVTSPNTPPLPSSQHPIHLEQGKQKEPPKIPRISLFFLLFLKEVHLGRRNMYPP